MSTSPDAAEQYADTPAGWAERWAVEFEASREALRSWRETGKRIVQRFRDERETAEEEGESRMNLFSANVLTQEALLYGRIPEVSVGRRYADSKDDVARMAGEMWERILNSGIEEDGDSYAEALGDALQDRLLPGLGMVRVRYEVETREEPGREAVMGPDGSELAPAVPPAKVKVSERVETDYVSWDDVMWSPAKTWKLVRWLAFPAEMTKEAVRDRFGADVAERIPYAISTRTSEEREKGVRDPWARAVVWEIWDKPTRTVSWFVEGHGELLDKKPDTLGLRGFFPCPKPMVANRTTDRVLPRPDFVLAQDLYKAVDNLTTRLDLLTEAVVVRGVYDKEAGALKSLLSSRGGNMLIPVDNWAMFADKGGLRGVVDWMPLDQVVNAIIQLSQRRESVKADLYEVTGMSDLLRGQAAAAGVTATEQSIKARFASVRLQRLQEEFARFASDVQRLKAEVISLHFDDATILKQSNAEQMESAQLAPQAIALMRERFSEYRVQVKPEAVSMTDFAELKSEAMEVLTGIAGFVQAMAPLAQQMPGSLPHLLKVLQWAMARIKGGGDIETVLDAAIEQAQQAAAQPQQAAPPDPKLLAQQMKGAQEMEKMKAETQRDLVVLSAEVQADKQREANQMEYNVREAAAKQQIAQAGRSQGQEVSR